jgi:hypothetical protein
MARSLRVDSISMPSYELNGLTLDSNIALPAVEREARTGGGRSLSFRIVQAPTRTVEEWLFTRTLLNGTPWLSVGRLDDGYVARVHGFADFELDREAHRIVCKPSPTCSRDIIEQLLLDQVAPMALYLRGQPAFHASAVGLESAKAVAFLGDSGAGKSTLAASLAGHQDQSPSFNLVADDCLVVVPSEAEVLVQPSYPSLRLMPDSASALFQDRPELPVVSARTIKRRVGLATPPEPIRLCRMYLLASGESATSINRLRKIDAFRALTGHLHRLDPTRRDCLEREMVVLERVANEVPVATLAYPRRYEDLPAVREAILADLADHP